MFTYKNVLITGASSGIGQALAEYYAQNGADVLFICGRNEERLNKVKENCEKCGAKVYAQVLDVCDREKVKTWLDFATQTAPIDLVFANAGTGNVNETEDAIYNTFNTNVWGVINTVLPMVKIFAQDKSFPKGIVIISSIAGYHGLPTCPAYSASKACVKAWGEAMRPILAKDNIHLSVVCPGFVRSRITDQNTCPMPFFMEAPKAAAIIAKGVAKNKGIIAFPWVLRFTTWLVSILPNCVSEFIYRLLPPKA